MRAVATRGRWLWGLSGLITTAALVVSGILLITSVGRAEHVQPQGTVTRTVTVPQPVTSLTVQSYGDPVQVAAGPVRHVQITETLSYDPQAGGPPAVAQSVSSGRLSVGDPACANAPCDVSFAVTVPSGVTVTVSTEGGSVTVSGVAGANVDSGNGPVRATKISGPLTVSTGGGSLLLDGLAGPLDADTGDGPLIAQGIASANAMVTTDGGDARIAFSAAPHPGIVTVSTDGGSLQLDGLADPLRADTGGGPLTVQGIASANATVSTDGGDARMTFSAAPDSVTINTDGGSAELAVPGGPYALTADSDGGPQSVGIATDPAAHRLITVISGGGPLLIGAAGQLPAWRAKFAWPGGRGRGWRASGGPRSNDGAAGAEAPGTFAARPATGSFGNASCT